MTCDTKMIHTSEGREGGREEGGEGGGGEKEGGSDVGGSAASSNKEGTCRPR